MPNLIALNAPAGSAGLSSSPSLRGVPAVAGALLLERRPLSACAAIQSEWSDLAARAIEPNLFFEPEFALPAAQHLVSFRNVSVLLVWQQETEGGRRLLAFIPSASVRRLFGPEELVGWSDPRIGSAAPLIDHNQAGRVIAAVLSAPGRWSPSVRRDLRFSGIDLEGPFALALLRAAETLSTAATLRAASPSPRPPAGGNGPGLAALRHGLSRHGHLAFAEAASRQELRDMVELVLALEASGALARAGAATLQDIRETAFLRTMTRNLARSRQCRAGLLTLDGEPVAGALLLGKGPRRWLYAAVEDERYASFAPLAQLVSLLRKQSRAGELVGHVPGMHVVTDALPLGAFRLFHTDARRRGAAAAPDSGLSLPRARAAG